MMSSSSCQDAQSCADTDQGQGAPEPWSSLLSRLAYVASRLMGLSDSMDGGTHGGGGGRGGGAWCSLEP